MENDVNWFGDFIGVGFRYHDIYMNVFPLFENKMAAYKLWKRTIEWWPDDAIKLRFIERNDNYWFILYGGSEYKNDNTGFVKQVPISENYHRFKRGYEDKAILRFGIYHEKNSQGQDDNSTKRYSLELLKKSKSVYDIKFIEFSNLDTFSTEFQCLKKMEAT